VGIRSRGRSSPSLRGRRLPTSPLPRWIAPQIARVASEPPAGDDWLHEIALDGHRVFARLDGDRVQLLARSGADWTRRLPALAREIAKLPAERAWIDGELVAMEPDGRTSNGALRTALAERRTDALVFVAFDLLHLDGVDLRPAPLFARKATLAGLLGGRRGGRIRYAEHVDGGGPAFFRAACRLGLDGCVSKRMNAPHRSGRGGDWVEVKGTPSGPLLALTHPDRVLYTESGITKRELAAYIASVADRMLPHVAGRPLTLVRCPEGLSSACFFQKRASGAIPAAIRADESRRLVVDSAAGLLALVQMGVLEIHVGGARADRPERPDRLVFDLDPDASVGWPRVVAAARRVRRELRSVGLESFVKTTGGKGLHVVVPIEGATWAEARAFSRAIADRLVREAPDRYTAQLSKAKRKGRILVDTFRNSKGATAVAAFSMRARPSAPVSVPLRWSELGDDLRSDAFTIRSLPARLARQRRDPWRGFFAVRQSLPT
jgi:bifunctional non-homologous end joining protein LigD